MLIKSLRLTNFLSFGEFAQKIELRPLNVMIGPNGSGKSNVFEAIDLLRAIPRDVLAQIRTSGGVHDLLWKGAAQLSPDAAIEAVLEYPSGRADLRYKFIFTEENMRFKIFSERIEDANLRDEPGKIKIYYSHHDNRTDVFLGDEDGWSLSDNFINPNEGFMNFEASILSQRKDIVRYPELTWIGNSFEKIRLYREWKFGRHATPRIPQKTDLPSYFLEPDCSNLGLVINRLNSNQASRKKLLNALQSLYERIDYVGVDIEGGTVQVFLQEGDYKIPSPRLSDGTMRYLCLLAILCHPDPPPLICIEEPELGLHPDVLPTLASLLVDASERTQLIVTTHSEVLVDALTDQPESIVVAEKGENGTTLKRLDAEALKPWLEKYRLGQLWTSGEIGGTRW